MISKRLRPKTRFLNMLSMARLGPNRVPRERLSGYALDPALGGDSDMLFTVKHLKQHALNRIMRQRLTGGRSMKVLGGRSVRAYRDGLLVHVGRDSRLNWHVPMSEPFGINLLDRRLVIASGDKVRLYDFDRTRVKVFGHEWFGQLHSVSFSDDGCRLLVVSTGFDSILEFDVESAAVTWFWNAWDHGYRCPPGGARVLRGLERASAQPRRARLSAEQRRRLGAGFGLPTGLSATHLNNAQYYDGDRIYVTLFHQGKAIIVDRRSGKVTEILGGLLNPHGFEPGWNGEKVVTDTRRGRVIFFDERLRVKRVLSIDVDAPVPSRHGLGEWLQNVLPLTEGLYGAIDIHRSCIWIVDPENKRYRKVSFSSEWAVQNVVALAPALMDALVRPLSEFTVTACDLADPERARFALGGRAGRPDGRER